MCEQSKVLMKVRITSQSVGFIYKLWRVRPPVVDLKRSDNRHHRDLYVFTKFRYILKYYLLGIQSIHKTTGNNFTSDKVNRYKYIFVQVKFT